MKFWIKNHPDIITGWNTKFFDLPYLMNRIKMVAAIKLLVECHLESNTKRRNTSKRQTTNGI